MKKIIYSTILLASVLFFSSCEKDLDRETFPHSVPVIESAKITGIDTAGSSSLIFGDSIEFVASVSDLETPLSTITFRMISNEGKLLLTDRIIVRGNSDEVKVRYKIPFVSNLDSQTPQVLLVLENSEGDSIHYNLPEADNIYFNRPTLGNNLYVVTDQNTVIELTKVGDYAYSVEDLDIETTDFKYRIAEKVDTDGKIDYTALVWGNTDAGVGMIDELSGASLSYTNNNTIITGLSFNAYTFEESIVTKEKDLKVINGTKLIAGTYDGYLSATLQLTNGQDLSLTGFDENSLNPDFFNYQTLNKATFLGLNGNYSVHYNLKTGFLYVEQTDATYPNAMWICGIGMGFPQESFAITTKWDWNVPSDYIFCRKVSEGIFQATFYANDFNFKFFHQRTWGGEEKSSNYTLVSNLWTTTDDGNWKAGDNFEAGVYKATINLNDKTTTLEKVN